MVYLIVLSCGVALAATWAGQRQAVMRLSALLVESTGERADAELRAFFTPVTAGLTVARDRSQHGYRGPVDVASLNHEFIPYLDRFPQISSVNTGDEAGNGLLLLRDGNAWRNREVHVDELGTRTHWIRWLTPGQPEREWWEDLEYDPRQRPWYQRVQEAARKGKAGPESEPHWTAPYTFFTTGDPGITASVLVEPAEGEPLVLAFDVMLNDISAYTTSLAPTENGMAIILTADGRVVGLPRHPHFQDPEVRRATVLQPTDALGMPVVEQAMQECRGHAGYITEPFAFRAEGSAWWGGFREFRLDDEIALWIGVLVPEDDFLSDVKRQRAIILMTTLAAIALASLLAVLMARSYSAPLTALARQSHRFRDLDLSESEDVPSNLLEVRALAEAHERMRRALDSFSRYVPTDLVRELLTRGEAARIGGRSATLTILFTDLHGFTALSESMSAADLVKLMARYFEVLLESLSRGGATIDKLLGDGLIGFWGAPKPNEDHAADAVRAVLACRDELEGLHQELRVPGRPPLHTRFGLATGEVVVGNVGSPTRLDYTALGDAVNLAERLEELNREYGTEILAGGQLRAATEGVIHWREVDSVRIRGRSESIPVHEPLGLRGEVSAERLEWARRYEEALALYRSQRFEAAAEVLSDLAGREERSATALRLWIRCLEARDRVD